MSQLLRSAAAIVVGFFTLTILISVWAAAVPAMWPAFGPQPNGTFVFAPTDHISFKIEMVVNVLTSAVAGYFCAALAGRRPGLHAAVLGCIMLGLSLAYALGWVGADFGAAKPSWAHLGTAMGLVLGLVLGVRFRQWRHSRKRPTS